MNLKMLTSKLIGLQVEEIIKNEIEIMTNIKHRHILNLYEGLEDEVSQKIYLVLEYCSKGALLSDHYWKAEDANQQTDTNLLLNFTRSLSLEKARHYFRQTAEAINYRSPHLTSVHNVENIFHNDIKPENLLVTSDDQIKLTDFGTATMVKPGEQDLIKNYDWGTRVYLPPEAWLSRLVCNNRARDAWEGLGHLGTRLYIL